MKKLLALILIIATMLLLVSCKPKDNVEIRVAYLNGPTGIGMAKMIHDHTDTESQYTFTKYIAPDKVVTDLNAGNIDIACLSTEVAAKFYNNGYDYQVLAINCLNSICLMVNDNVSVSSIYDLEGQTICTSKQGTPKLILEALLEAYGVNATITDSYDGETVINTPDQLPQVITQNKADIILAPVHVAYNTLANPNTKHRITLNIDELWDAKFDTPIAMGCVVARTEFINNHPDAVKSFLDEYAQSIAYMTDSQNVDTAAEYIVDSTILPNLIPAKNTLAELSEGIKFVSGSTMKTTLINIYNVFGLATVGGKLHDDNFYYGE